MNELTCYGAPGCVCRRCYPYGYRMCVCLHSKGEHERRQGVLACTVSGCACGPGCIHNGFVCDDGTVLDDERLSVPTTEAERALDHFLSGAPMSEFEG